LTNPLFFLAAHNSEYPFTLSLGQPKVRGFFIWKHEFYSRFPLPSELSPEYGEKRYKISLHNKDRADKLQGARIRSARGNGDRLYFREMPVI
jgi:hypothetical protein